MRRSLICSICGMHYILPTQHDDSSCLTRTVTQRDDLRREVKSLKWKLAGAVMFEAVTTTIIIVLAGRQWGFV